MGFYKKNLASPSGARPWPGSASDARPGGAIYFPFSTDRTGATLKCRRVMSVLGGNTFA